MIVPLPQPDNIEDASTAFLRSGARRLLAQATEAEGNAFLALVKGERLRGDWSQVLKDADQYPGQ